MRTVLSIAITTVALAAALPAAAQFAKPEEAIKYRQAAFVLMSQHFTRIAAMARGRAPYDQRAAVENAEMVATLARLPWPAFGPNTEKLSSGVKSEAWSEHARFKELNEKLVAESAKLVTAAKTNNLEQVKTAFNATAATCKGCHDAYRTN